MFLTDGNVPIDNSASERALRTFCVGKKNWVLFNSVKGAHASAVIYSITETAKLNGLNPYYYLDHILTEMPKMLAEKDPEQEHPDPEKLRKLLPWAEILPGTTSISPLWISCRKMFAYFCSSRIGMEEASEVLIKDIPKDDALKK